VMTPAVVIRPTRLPLDSANHKLPSGPTVMPRGWLSSVGTANSEMLPAVSMRPILLAYRSVNHSALSGPAVISQGLLVTVVGQPY
jgi:hypothetical protein